MEAVLDEPRIEQRTPVYCTEAEFCERVRDWGQEPGNQVRRGLVQATVVEPARKCGLPLIALHLKYGYDGGLTYIAVCEVKSKDAARMSEQGYDAPEKLYRWLAGFLKK